MTEFTQALLQGLLIGSTYGLMALGMGLIYSVSGLVNFSHGDFISLAMYLSLPLFWYLSLDPYVSVIVTVPVMTVLGAVVYVALIQRLAGHKLLMVIQLTLACTFIIQNLLLITFGGHPLRVPSVVETSLLVFGDIVVRWSHVIAFAASFALAVCLYVMLRTTDIGRAIRAVHQNARAAALMGINVPRVRVVTFGIGIGILAVAAALLLPGATLNTTQGFRYTVITMLVFVLGGMTNFVGIMFGGLIIGVSEALGYAYLPSTIGLLLPYLIFIAIVLYKPRGLA